MSITIPVPPTADRAIFFGNTREGKSQLVKAILRAKKHVIVIDTKQREDWGDVGEYVDGKKIYDVGEGRYIWRPDIELSDDDLEEEFNTFFRWVMEQGNRVIFVDEIVDVARSAQKFPRAYRRATKTGAAAGLGIWGSTQEPRGIPLWTVGQADYLFTFHVGLPEYRQRIDQIFEMPVPWNALPTRSYQFVWKDRDGLHGPTKLDLDHPNAPRPTMRRTAPNR